MKRHILAVFFTLTLSPQLFSQVPDSINHKLADLYFKITDVLCSFDNAQLWGKPLNGPLMFVDRRSRKVICNQADFWGNLAPKGKLFLGQIPDKVVIANSTVNWAGVDWAMLMWPLPTGKHERNVAILRQQFKRIAPELGIPINIPKPLHINEMDARILIQLEWRALNAALRQEGKLKNKSINDALLFRGLRHLIYPDASREESLLELTNGLAEYTGLKISQLPDELVFNKLAEKMHFARKLETFMGIYGEITGLFYATLLDQSGMLWRNNITGNTDLAELTRKNYTLIKQTEVDKLAKVASERYDVEEIREVETKRDETVKQRVAVYKSKLVSGPVLLLPLEVANLQFDPRSTITLSNLGTIYPNLVVNDIWGRLIVKSGALVNSKVTRLYVPLPTKKDFTTQYIETEDFILELDKGWVVKQGKRSADLELIREQ